MITIIHQADNNNTRFPGRGRSNMSNINTDHLNQTDNKAVRSNNQIETKSNNTIDSTNVVIDKSNTPNVDGQTSRFRRGNTNLNNDNNTFKTTTGSIAPQVNNSFQQAPSVNNSFQRAPSVNNSLQQTPNVSQQTPNVNNTFQNVPQTNNSFQNTPQVNNASQQTSNVNNILPSHAADKISELERRIAELEKQSNSNSIQPRVSRRRY